MGGGLCASYLSAPLIPPGIYPKAEGSSQKAEQGSAAPAPNPTTSSPKRQVLTNRGAGEGRRKGWRQEVRAARTLQPARVTHKINMSHVAERQIVQPLGGGRASAGRRLHSPAEAGRAP